MKPGHRVHGVVDGQHAVVAHDGTIGSSKAKDSPVKAQFDHLELGEARDSFSPLNVKYIYLICEVFLFLIVFFLSDFWA